ncbi:hypothetical protein JCM8202_004095 [Rhodotorula sphaerocarpa]
MDRLHGLLERAEHLTHVALERYRDLSLTGKAIVWFTALLNLVSGIGFLVIGPERIFAWFASLADDIRDMPYGWVLLSLIIVVTSIPPLIGYGTAQTLVGFAYGVAHGFVISAVSCLLGGAVAFLLVRRLVHLFAPYLRRQKTFAALSRAVRVKGLPLIVLLRLCPFPYPYSNAFFASIETVSFYEFMLATLAITPKLLLHVFIGHRTYLFADPASRHKMDPTTRWINGIFMVGGTVLGIGTSWYLYQLTMRYVSEAGEESDAGALEAGLLRDVDDLLGGPEDPEEVAAGGGGEPRSYDGLGDEEELLGQEEATAGAGRRGAKALRDGKAGTRTAVPEGALLDVDDDEDGTGPYPAGGGASPAAKEAEPDDGWGDDFSDYSRREPATSIELDRSGGGGAKLNGGAGAQGGTGGKGHGRADSLAWGLDDDDEDDDDQEERNGTELGEMQASPSLAGRTKTRLD